MSIKEAFFRGDTGRDRKFVSPTGPSDHEREILLQQAQRVFDASSVSRALDELSELIGSGKTTLEEILILQKEEKLGQEFRGRGVISS